MSRVKIPYTSVIGGRRYWQAKPEMRDAGFTSRCFGPDGPAAQAEATAFYAEWLRFKSGAPGPTPEKPASAAKRYAAGTVGAAWQRWTRTEEWQRKAQSTRDKIWWPAWTLRIEPIFGDMRPTEITLEDISLWRARIVELKGQDVAHKAMKVWRKLWKIMAAFQMCQRGADPSLEVINSEPAPRTQEWAEGEIVRLVKAGWRVEDERTMAVVIAVAWDTQFSPVDVRTLTRGHLKRDPVTDRLLFDRRGDGRAKTGVATIGTLSARTDRLLRAFLGDRLDTDMVASTPLFPRPSTGRIWKPDEFSKDFGKLRERVFPGELRQMRDLRRSGVNEARAGGATVEDVATKMANGMNRTDRLFKTYSPVAVEPIRRADEARQKGRAAIRARNGNGTDV